MPFRFRIGRLPTIFCQILVISEMSYEFFLISCNRIEVSEKKPISVKIIKLFINSKCGQIRRAIGWVAQRLPKVKFTFNVHTYEFITSDLNLSIT